MATWTKSDAACEQIDAAIGLLSEKKFIAAHSLACAGLELATDAARADGKRTNHMIFEDVVKANAPERLSEVKQALRRPQNFAKHADRDHKATIEVEPELTVYRLFAALFDLGIAFERQSLRQLIYRVWFTARYPDVVLAGNDALIAGAQQLFARVDQMSLGDALDRLHREVLNLDADDMRKRFDRSMADAKIDWSASTRSWTG